MVKYSIVNKDWVLQKNNYENYDLDSKGNGLFYFVFGLAASLVFHLSFLVSLSKHEVSSFQEPIMVNFVSLPIPPSIQEEPKIVSEPQSTIIDTTNDEAKFLAEKDHVTEKEQIKRGDEFIAEKGHPIPPSPNKQPSVQKQVESKKVVTQKNTSEQKKVIVQNKSLLLNEADTFKQFGSPLLKQEINKPKSIAEILDNNSTNSEAEPFSRPKGSGAAFWSNALGSNDYLPHLPDGDITLLNTKASNYAVFVRRVATQVFGQLRNSGWNNLRRSDILLINDFTSIKAVMSPNGTLLSAKIEKSSGSPAFDRIVLLSVNSAAKDSNPPKSAALNDGNIHFIFEAKSWTKLLAASSSGAPGEWRWLLLRTGLE